MENTLVFYIESAKKRIADLEKKKQTATDDYREGLTDGQLIAKRHELNVLENLLAQQQKEEMLTDFVYKESVI